MNSTSLVLLLVSFLMMCSLTLTMGNVVTNPNDILRDSINNAAGMELIPKGTKFKLTEFHGTATESSVSFPNGGSGYVSGSVYTGKLNGGASSSANQIMMTAAGAPLTIYIIMIISVFRAL